MKKITHIGRFAIVSTLVSLGITAQVFAYTTITSQLDLGESNSDVTSLQGFFADNKVIYPEGIVTGYFGDLTKSAVQRFQSQYGLAQVGRVGPLTRDAINNLINQGGWTMSDVSGPWISYVTKSLTSNSATFVWNTDENATGKIFYGTSPVTMNEGDSNSVGFGSTNGLVMTNDGLARTSQQVILTGLQPNTIYYYVVVATDLKGNVSVWNPNTMFRTNP